MGLRDALSTHSKTVLSLTGFLATILAIYGWFTAPSERIQAEVYYADFELPAPIAQQFTALAPLTAPDAARSEFFKPNLRHRILPDTSGTVDQIVNSVATYVRSKAPAIDRRTDFLYKGFWRVTVRNPGSRAASNVVLHFPVPAAGVVSRPKADQTSLQQLPTVTSQAVSLGNIQGGEDSVVYYAWTLTPATEDIAKKITVTHDLGSGRVQVVR